MAAGRVCTGFSKPYVATYSNAGNVVTYSSGQLLARGVSVNLQPESAEDNNFYADNIVAESAAGEFIGGTVELEVDGLFRDTEDLIFGSPEAVDGWVGDGDASAAPYCGVGFIVRWMSDGVTKYQPVVLPKVKFNIPEEERATQEDEIDWQTTTLVATLMRDDTVNKNWRYRGAEFSTEALAEAELQEFLGISGGATT
jgi:phi13 family phage major tail protein